MHKLKSQNPKAKSLIHKTDSKNNLYCTKRNTKTKSLIHTAKFQNTNKIVNTQNEIPKYKKRNLKNTQNKQKNIDI